MRPNNNTLVPGLNEKFSGFVWKIKVHGSGLLAIETRNSESKQVSFSSLNFKTGQTYFKERLYHETWNLSLAFAGSQNFILNAFEHSQTPESKGVLSVSASDGTVLWEQYNISLNEVRDGGLGVYDTRIQPRKYYWIDHLTASPIAPPAVDNPAEISFPEYENSFTFPGFIQHGEVAGEISFLEHSGKNLLSFHEIEGGRMKQRLVVYQEDKILLDDILISGIQKLQPEAFFIQQNHLFYVRNKEEILAYLV
ncbi:DUF4905 domain-containing protein [Daejeonella lutea]|uniref:DUF4905 domain-containing protein n=1 Tax=Daejeonella lutea TaxID=572036 RepID=A0A1T5AFG3_9SPHI|nr:DUF4905 domain-containing protein [Daejeonella lutea]SKB33718.1 protein of unknown function [Daejeonella lutea]